MPMVAPRRPFLGPLYQGPTLSIGIPFEGGLRGLEPTTLVRLTQGLFHEATWTNLRTSGSKNSRALAATNIGIMELLKGKNTESIQNFKLVPVTPQTYGGYLRQGPNHSNSKSMHGHVARLWVECPPQKNLSELSCFRERPAARCSLSGPFLSLFLAVSSISWRKLGGHLRSMWSCPNRISPQSCGTFLETSLFN